MRATVTVAVASRGGREDALIDAPDATPSGEVVSKLAALVGAHATDSVLLEGRPIDVMAPLAASGLREGAVVSFGEVSAPKLTNGRPAVKPRGCLELRVVGGPGAGATYPLAIGATTIGRAATNDVVLDDDDVSRRHATLVLSASGATIADAGSTNGTMLDGSGVGETPAPIAPGARLRVGESTLLLAAPDEPPVALAPAADGRLTYNRPPRLGTTRQPSSIEFPIAPVEREPARLPLVATIAPLVAGVALAAVMRRPEYLLFTVLSPVMMAAQWLADRVGHRKSARAGQRAYRQARVAAESQLHDALAAEAVDRRFRSPDPALVARIANAPSTRLWERRRGDADFLRLRLGTGTLRAEVQVVNDAVDPAVFDVPVTVGLADVGVLGIAGPPDRCAALARSLVGQLATLHSPRELGIVLLADPARAASWEPIRWLPHLRPSEPGRGHALVGLDPAGAAARIAELNALIAERHSEGSHDARAFVVLIDGARAMRELPGLPELLSRAGDGVFAICVDSDESRLPQECAVVASFFGDTATRLRLHGAAVPTVADIVADGVSIGWAERVGRALAPLRDAGSGTAGAGALPDAIRWLELAQLEAANHAADPAARLADELAQRWRRTTGGCTVALVGAAADGPFTVDLAKDGPHALIAGTTGSGKSELLQTLVASLAVANRPDELSFVLVDYKGGAAFGACATLPHTVGVVTDLDGRLVERALVSLTAELKRREALLASVAAVNIDAYRRTGAKLARLVIVVDEFASLAEELPDFVGGLVGIAQRGRSLGVHLVLATQRPEGAVSADIRANTNLRICLAVMRDSESRDVIDCADATRISRATPGRGFARTGHGELHAFQAGRVGGRTRSRDGSSIEVRHSPFRSIGLGDAPERRAAAEASELTDLDRIVDACRTAANCLDIETPASPWLPPLPDTVVTPAALDQPLRVAVGVRDIPARQAREPHVIDLTTTGHLLIAGSARSGRSTALRTLAGSLARSTSTADLHMYALDCAGGSLGALGGLPHCGGVTTGAESDRARRLVSMLVGELAERQGLLATAGFGSLNEQRRSAATPLHHIVVFIDSWEPFVATFDDVDGGSVVAGVFRLLGEGTAVGIHVVASCDRAGLVGRLASIVENRLVLRLADRGDFALIGLSPRAIPTDLPAGRGFLADDLTETQVCLLDPDPSGAAQLQAFAAIAETTARRDADLPAARRPRRVEPLPTRVARSEVRRHIPEQGSGRILLGVGGDELEAVSVDLLETGPGFVVAGPPRSGRSSALATVATGLRESGWRVLAVTARPSPIRNFVDETFDAGDLAFDDALQSCRAPVALVVDDAELVTETPAATVLDRFMRTARDSGRVVAIAGTTEDLAVGFRGFIVDARRSRTGVLLTPRSPFDGEAFGVRLPRDTGGRLPPGRGLLVSRGVAHPLQLAMPT